MAKKNNGSWRQRVLICEIFFWHPKENWKKTKKQNKTKQNKKNFILVKKYFNEVSKSRGMKGQSMKAFFTGKLKVRLFSRSQKRICDVSSIATEKPYIRKFAYLR